VTLGSHLDRRYRDLTGATLTLYGKQDKTRTVEISQRLSDAINARRKRLGAGSNDLLFPNCNGNPNQHLLRDLQTLAKRAGAQRYLLHSLRLTLLPVLPRCAFGEETARIYLWQIVIKAR
jgi:site-specific recombinase XerD